MPLLQIFALYYKKTGLKGRTRTINFLYWYKAMCYWHLTKK
jgi:hypothetical protein